LVDKDVPAGSYDITLLSHTAAMTVHCDGTKFVTVDTQALADTLFAGQTMLGYTVPNGRKIVAISGLTLEMDGPVPATCPRASFADLDAEWAQGKLAKDLVAIGVKSARFGPGGSGNFTAFGQEPLATLSNGGTLSIDSTNNVQTIINTLQMLVSEGQDIVMYAHEVSDATLDTYWRPLLQAIKDLQDSGKAQSVTVGEGMRRAYARPQIS
jgi:hypothetical protein